MILKLNMKKEEQKKIIENMNTFLQTEIFGSKEFQSEHEYIKLGQDGKMESIAMQNKECRKVFNKITGLIDILYTPAYREKNPDIESHYLNLVSFCTSYHRVLEELWEYKFYTDVECDAMQLRIDNFMVIYRNMFSADVTNYFHYLDSGHVIYFLKKYNGNIMQYANQGWEGLNAWVKMIILTKTQRGGACGVISQKMRKRNESAVLDFCLRRLVWTFGYSNAELRDMINENEN